MSQREKWGVVNRKTIRNRNEGVNAAKIRLGLIYYVKTFVFDTINNGYHSIVWRAGV